jgi:DNA-binding NarL/FixJ family response regulator
MGRSRVTHMSTEYLRVLIVDGHLAVARGLKALVEAIPGLCVVGLATRGERGLAQAALTRPDVALVDAELPGLCSAAVIRLLRWRLPRTRVIALGIYPERRRAALQAGAHAFVLKDAGYDALRAAIAGEIPEALDTAGTAEALGWLPAAVTASPTAGSATGSVGDEERVRSWD